MSIAPAPPPFPAAPSVQTAIVADDRPCVGCRYNLRGQTLTWNRLGLQWRATCPECGLSQAIALETAPRRSSPADWTTYAVIAAVAWAAWHAASMLAWAVARMMSTPSAAMSANAAAVLRGGGLPRGVTPPRMLDADGFVIVTHIATQTIPLALTAAAIGVLAWAAPSSNGRQRLWLTLIVVCVAWFVGVWSNLSGFKFDDDDVTSAVYRAIAQMSGGGRPTAGATFETDWQWKLVGAVASLLIATLAARAGLFFGGPLARLLREMFLPDAKREAR